MLFFKCFLWTSAICISHYHTTNALMNSFTDSFCAIIHNRLETMMDERRKRSRQWGQPGHLLVREQWPHFPEGLHVHSMCTACARMHLNKELPQRQLPREIWTYFSSYKCVCVPEHLYCVCVCVSVRERWPRPPALSQGGSLQRVTGPPLKRRLRNTHSAWDKINTRLRVGAP